MPSYLETVSGRRIAYHKTEGTGPGIVFLGGFMSDMTGTKAVFLQDWAERTGRAFLRFDYSGHGQSSEEFTDGCIGDWFADAAEVIGALTEGPQVLVGSSMGGWIALLVARSMPQKVAGMVGIAAAPDFTEDSMWASFTDAQRAELSGSGRVELPSDYDDGPYIITRRLIEDGRNHLVLRAPLQLNVPVCFLQGTVDVDVPMGVALNLLNHVSGSDIQLTLVKGADHRFSTPACLEQIRQSITAVVAQSEGKTCC